MGALLCFVVWSSILASRHKFLTGTSRARVSLKFMLPYGLGRIQVILMVAVELLMYVEAVGEITFVLVLQGEHPH